MGKRIVIIMFILGLLSSCKGKELPDADKPIETGHSTPTTALEWTQNTYVDEFGQPTGQRYEFAAVEGKFSNSATTNSKLYVAITVERDSTVSFRLGEYGSHVVKNVDLNGKARDNHGNIKDFYLYMNNNGWGTYIPIWTSDFIKMLTSGDRVDIVLTEDTKYGVPSTYYFTIPENSGLGEAMARVQ